MIDRYDLFQNVQSEALVKMFQSKYGKWVKWEDIEKLQNTVTLAKSIIDLHKSTGKPLKWPDGTEVTLDG